MPAALSSSRVGPGVWQHDTSCPSTTTAGTTLIPYSAALSATVDPEPPVKAEPSVALSSWTVTSQSGQANSFTSFTAGSQTGQPAVKTSTWRFALCVP